MTKHHILLLATFFLCGTSSAWASPSPLDDLKLLKPDLSAPVRVNIPEVNVPAFNDRILFKHDKGVGQIEVGASSWFPSHLRVESVSGTAGAFERSSAPEINIGLVSSKFDFIEPVGLSALVEFGFLPMTRSTSGAGSSSQSGFLLPIKAGFQSSPPAVNWRGIHPFVQAYAMPTILLTVDSGVDEGTTYFGVPYGMSVGSTFDGNWIFGIDQKFSFIQIEAAATMTAGEVHSGSVLGFGFDAGLRFAI